MLTPRTKITADAVKKLVPAFWGKPRIAALMQSWTEEVQELETAIFTVIDSRILDNAVGVQLSTLGVIVGQKNFGWDDISYRAAIRARIRANRTNGNAFDLIEVARLLAPGGTFSVTDDADPATVRLAWTSAVTVITQALADILKDTRAAGVKMYATRPFATPVFTYRKATDTSIQALGYAYYGATGGNYLGGFTS